MPSDQRSDMRTTVSTTRKSTEMPMQPWKGTGTHKKMRPGCCQINDQTWGRPSAPPENQRKCCCNRGRGEEHIKNASRMPPDQRSDRGTTVSTTRKSTEVPLQPWKGTGTHKKCVQDAARSTIRHGDDRQQYPKINGNAAT